MNDHNIYLRAKGLSSLLTTKTQDTRACNIFVSEYVCHNKWRYSLRFNELDNRINGLDMKELFYTLYNLLKEDCYVTPVGLHLTKRNIHNFWPKGRRVEKLFLRFFNMNDSSNNQLRKYLLLDEINNWEERLNNQL